MATIIEFKSARDDNDREKAEAGDTLSVATDAGTAQIIFFPGIRIERYDLDPYIEEDEMNVAELAGEQTKSSKA